MRKYKKILVLSLLVLTFFVSGTAHAQAATFRSCSELICNPAPDLFSTTLCSAGAQCSFDVILFAIIKLLLGFAGLVALGFIIIGGYQLITSGGNEDATKNGKKTLTNAIIGLVIIILSYVIITVVINTVLQANGPLPSTPTVPNSTTFTPGG